MQLNMNTVRDLADEWLRIDRDNETRLDIQFLVESEDHAELKRRLAKRISFGTAGLRAPMKAGFAFMNPLTVLKASQGLADYIIAQDSSDEQHSVVIGHDARHNSDKFARLAAAAFLEKGLKVLWYETLVHTPMVPFAVGHYGASAGVMVTASHNPKNDNGYKVYWNNGCQIIPPHDAGIAKCIDLVSNILSWDASKVDTDGNVRKIYEDAHEAYFTALRQLVTSLSGTTLDATAFTYTPMHGVGLPFMQQAVRILGVPSGTMHVVQEQAQPDPEFSTVPFPNPEERGALDLALKTAASNSSKLILANDPDADRFAVAEQLPNGEWQQLTGNQMGILLASHVLDTYVGDKYKLAMLASTVSSRMLSAMAQREGFQFRETLTGFKWLGNAAQTLCDQGYDAAYAYEEAIGYMFPSTVWDKDGIAAASIFLIAWQRWRSQGLTPWTKLQTLYGEYGFFEDANTYLISPSPDVTNQVFADIRELNEGQRPEVLGGNVIKRWRDLTLGYDSATDNGVPYLPVDASAQMITCEMDDVVFTVRGSGTEPKIKLYIEGTAKTSKEAKGQAKITLENLLQEWFRPQHYGLRLAGS